MAQLDKYALNPNILNNTKMKLKNSNNTQGNFKKY